MAKRTENGVTVAGRVRDPYTTVRAYRSGVQFRVDCNRDMAFWLEINVSVERLRELLAEIEDCRSDEE